MATPSNYVSAADDKVVPALNGPSGQGEAAAAAAAAKSAVPIRSGKALRFSISLNGEIKDEAKLIGELSRWPQGRRQQRIRMFIDDGGRSLGEGRTYERFKKSEGGSMRMRVFVHLQPASPDDQDTLDRLQEVPKVMLAQWLKEALIVGFLQSSTRSLDIDLTCPGKDVTRWHHSDSPTSYPQSELPNAADAAAGHQRSGFNISPNEVDILLDGVAEQEIAEAQAGGGIGAALRGLYE